MQYLYFQKINRKYETPFLPFWMDNQTLHKEPNITGYWLDEICIMLAKIATLKTHRQFSQVKSAKKE